MDKMICTASGKERLPGTLFASVTDHRFSRLTSRNPAPLGGLSLEVLVKNSICVLALLLVVLGLSGSVQAQTPVNIVYPIDGGTYPITGPAPGPLNSAYFTSSFSVTCGGGGHTVSWGFDGNPPLGTANFYDQTSSQFVYKLPGGVHTFWVNSDCGVSQVRFRIGN